LGENLQLDAGRGDRPVADLDLAAERSEVRVVLEQVPHRLRVAEVVDRHDLEAGVPLQPSPKEVPPDPPESVDTDPRSHAPPGRLPLASLVGRCAAGWARSPELGHRFERTSAAS